MTRPFRFAVQAGGDSAQAVRDVARLAESLGYEALYTFDHVGTIDPFAPLIVAADATDRLRVGPLVINNELHNPVLLARTAATVDLLTDGRLDLGLGTGYAQAEHEAIGSPISPPGLRVERFGEALRILRSLLNTGAARSNGHYSVAVDRLGVRPANPHVPMLIGGHGRRVVALGAHYADIFQYTGLTHAPDGQPQAGGFARRDVAIRHQWLDAEGRSIERSILVQRTALDEAAPAALAELESGGLAFDAEQVEDTPFLLIGSRSSIVEKLLALRDEIGVSHVVVRDPAGFAPVVEELRGR